MIVDPYARHRLRPNRYGGADYFTLPTVFDRGGYYLMLGAVNALQPKG